MVRYVLKALEAHEQALLKPRQVSVYTCTMLLLFIYLRGLHSTLRCCWTSVSPTDKVGEGFLG